MYPQNKIKGIEHIEKLLEGYRENLELMGKDGHEGELYFLCSNCFIIRRQSYLIWMNRIKQRKTKRVVRLIKYLVGFEQ